MNESKTIGLSPGLVHIHNHEARLLDRQVLVFNWR